VRDGINFSGLTTDYTKEDAISLGAGSWLVQVKGQASSDGTASSAVCGLLVPNIVAGFHFDSMSVTMEANGTTAMLLTEAFTQNAPGPVEIHCKDDNTGASMGAVSISAIQVGSVDADEIF
jgi:hypothetical protein